MIIKQKDSSKLVWKDGEKALLNEWHSFSNRKEFLHTIDFANGFINDYHLRSYISDRRHQHIPKNGPDAWDATNILEELRYIEVPNFAMVVPDTALFHHFKAIANYLLNYSGKNMNFQVFERMEDAEAWAAQKASKEVGYNM